MKRILSSLILTMIVCVFSYGQTDVEYKSTLKEMMLLSGSEETYQMAIKQMMTMLKQQKSEVPESVWSELEAEFLKTSLNELVDMLTPVYQKHLTIEDIKGLIEFYKSPLGKKFAKKTPLITQESMQAGQQWGMKIGQEFTKKLSEKGY